MCSLCLCLLAFISHGIAFHEALPWYNNRLTKLSAGGNHYGASIGFNRADITDYPYLTSITYEIQSFPAGAGAILNKHWVLSAAYVSELAPEYIKIYTGTDNAGRSGQRINVTKIIRHKKYNPVSPNYNIAVLKTETPITFSDTVKPVKLANAVPKAGTNCTIVGYGYLQDKPYVGWELGAATVQVLSKDICNSEHRSLKNCYCAESDGVVPCYGDVGDLMMYNNKLAGFYIGGDFCNTANKSELYTNVPAYRKWIWKTIKSHSSVNEMEGIDEKHFM